ncbi:class I SAM-dependent methyltransferase [Acidihalobacter ferrooxydans]|uniref:Methyltransferase type 11 n=1 Tax=Acidihalobacter ferrooxydans TaxID=1765967 RepID=A0A1P8UJE8_9GAMM|nr:class I SAM-dependent methyltransferase [Acidihalobacter ferrooxydans]APZ43965.1 methyltransferase type 11 [Acidihalobacter ferrooxydans]
MTETHTTRLPHAVLDLPSRRLKGLKIERLLDLAALPQPIEMLEIGTGSGGIAHYFATHETLRCQVTAVDVIDQRLQDAGFDFRLVEGTTLPFADARFDVVISNHVIEHVGDEAAQRHHLAEVRRVMRPAGMGYLAVPNRWMLVEPHYRLAFLSWLPMAWRTPYLRAMRRGRVYDCNPPSLRRIQRLLTDSGFHFEYLSTRALRETLAIERNWGMLARTAAALPDALLDRLAPFNPTLIFKLTRA